MGKKVVIAGGTGFIGKYFKSHFQKLGYTVYIISRNANITWNQKDTIRDTLEHADLLINLAGKSVNCRYHRKNRKEIYQSRTGTTHILGEAIQQCEHPPPLWVNASTATIYRHAEDRPMTEENGELGTGFSVDVAEKWEQAFFQFSLSETRQVALRIAIVLGPNGGVLTPYKQLVKFGLGGKQGSGKQMFSFIHVEDLFQIVLFLQDKKELHGIFNCSAPHPVNNKEFMQTIRQSMNRQFGLPAPKPLLELGALLIRTETELMLKSRWVVPQRLTDAGFSFRFPTIEQTIQDAIET
ncbi:TIGR01777 family oxidoreductase [Gracilibacillus halophilus]|uniref:TIGR01777 family oxidoreductase n=1 Tax=Gracilibacillus halophilus TaxID=470864 RepID=UPI00058E9D1D|nr:TIGR01777 family oxidoreductase [Gracilibacillus halophilus]